VKKGHHGGCLGKKAEIELAAGKAKKIRSRFSFKEYLERQTRGKRGALKHRNTKVRRVTIE